MQIATLRVLILCGVLFAAAAPGRAAGEPATLIVVGGRVWTADAAVPWAEAVAVRGNRILSVGTRQQVELSADANTVVINAAGKLVTPGFIDAHIHLFDGGRNLNSVQLRDADSQRVLVDRLTQYVATLEPGQWVLGGDWDHTRWGGALPTRDWIDAVTPDNPVWIQRLDGHMALANSLALQRAKIDDSAVAPDGGTIERDPSGRITGIFRDNAMPLISRAVPQPSSKQMLAELDAATKHLHARGVTCAGHMGSLAELRVLRAARAAGRLRLRVHAATPLPRWRLLVDDLAKNGHGDDWVAAGGLKGFVDGSLGSHTAAMLEPFSDAPADRGLLVNSPEELYAWTSSADAAGLQVMVHAIGDRAIRLQLDIFERVARENEPRDRRFRIEHAQHIHPDDLSRFSELGVLASMQPYHAIDDGRWAEGVIGHRRSKTSYAFRSLLEERARLAFGSDWFVAPVSVTEGIYAAVTRRTLDGEHADGWIPAQRITVEEALRAYTIDAAYAMFAEDKIGSLQEGKLADLVVLETDVTRCEPVEINKVHVICTVIGGEIAYASDELNQ